MCAYAPGVANISGQLLGQGISSLGDSIASGIKQYQANKTMANQAIGDFEGLVRAQEQAKAANPTLYPGDTLLEFLTKSADGDAPSEGAKAFKKLHDQGTLGYKDAALLAQLGRSYSKEKDTQMQQALQQQQTAFMQQQAAALQQKTQEDQQRRAEEAQMNARMDQMLGAARGISRGSAPMPAAPGGPMGSMLPQGGGYSGSSGPTSMGTSRSVAPVPGNMGGAGVMDPQAAQAAVQFMRSPLGQLRQQGVQITPAIAQRMAEVQANTASREEIAGIRGDALQQTQAARADANAARMEAAGLKGKSAQDKTAFDEMAKLRDQFSAQQDTKNFDVVNNFYTRGARLAKEKTSAGDMGLIFALMKLYDPNSTVREGEYATAAQSGTLDQNIVNLYNKAFAGGKLQPEQRAEFLRTMKIAAETQYEKLAPLVEQYTAIAKSSGYDPNKVIASVYSKWKPEDTAPTGPQKVGRFIIEASP